jgi:hypothetical protein
MRSPKPNGAVGTSPVSVCPCAIADSFEDLSPAPLVTFIIPSTGRETLNRTLRSLELQSEPAWCAIVLFDGCPAIVESDSRVQVLALHEKVGAPPNFAGQVRNVGLQHVVTPWVAFVDDDDTVDHYYVSSLRSELHHHPDVDLIVFRMQYEDGFVLPPLEDIERGALRPDYVGISYAIRMDFCRRHELAFDNSRREDYDLLNRMMNLTQHYRLSSRIAYFVRHWRPSLPPHWPELIRTNRI